MKKAILIGTILATALLFTQQAQAQCGSGFGISICGQIFVNPPVVVPQVVVQRPVVVVETPPVYIAPPVVYSPPPVVYSPPPVIYSPPPQPVIVQQPAPVLVQSYPVVAPAPRLVLRRPARNFARHRGVGFGLRAGAGYAGEESSNFGGSANIRYIASPRFGVELTVDAFAGNGYTGDVDRTEFPITLNALWFVNPRSRVQLYVVAGLGVSIAAVEAANGETDDPIYGGGELGIGVEFLLGQHIGLTLDARGFLRGRMNDREYDPTSPVSDGSCRMGDANEWECTDLEAGITFNAGFNFYL